mgnify:CR=1 FL=1
MTRQVELIVNDTPIDIDYFIQSFIDHTLGGMIESLERTGPIENLDISVRAENVAITLNGEMVPTNSFVKDLVKSTVEGMVMPLKGVDGISTLRIAITR